MRTILPSIAILSSLLLAGVAVAAERSFPAGSFDKLRVTGPMDVKVTTGPKASVRAVGATRDLDRLEIAVRDGTLVIGSKSGVWNWGDDLDVFVTTPSLSAVALTGAGDVDVNHISGPKTELSVTGSGDLDVDSLQSEQVSITLTGSGDVEVDGRCTSGQFQLSGSGDIDADGLVCRTLDIAVRGSGDVEANASDTATINILGSGDVTVIGGARCKTTARGSGTARCS